MRRRIEICALAVAGMVLGTAQRGWAETADTIRKGPAPMASQAKRLPVTPAVASEQDQAAAQKLAAELASAGITVPSQEVNSLVQAIADGGSAAMQLAMSMISAIAEAKSDPSRTSPASAHDPAAGQSPGGSSLTTNQIDGLIAKLPPDTSLTLTRFLKYKLTQARKTRP